MNQEPVIKALMSLGLSETDTQVYIYLAKKGPQRREKIAEALKTDGKHIYRCLRNLQCKGIVNIALEPTWFLAVPFNKVIDIIAKVRKQEARNITQNKEAILSSWQSLILNDSTG